MNATASIKNEPTEFVEPQTEDISGNGQYVTFSCSNNAYGVDIMSVREIRSWTPTTELPNQPTAACGVLDIRGEVIQVYDLNALLGAARTEVSDGHVVIVVSINGTNAGILADAVSDIIQVSEDDMRPVPNAAQKQNSFVSGLAKHEDNIVAILNLDSII